MDDTTVSQQAAFAGDVETPENGGRTEVPLVSDSLFDEEPRMPAEGDAAEDTDTLGKDRRVQQKKEEKSQKIWQENTEKAKKAEKILEALTKIVEPEATEPKEPENVLVKLQNELSTLRSDVARKDWEAEHPFVRSEDYREAWAKVNADPRYGVLTFDERWALIRKDTPSSTTPIRLREQELNVGSVPMASKSPVMDVGEIDPQVYQWMKAKGYSDAQIKASL
jgi:hypothetical protein